MPQPRYYIGLMSGTSIDAADAALVEFNEGASPDVIATYAQPPDATLREELLNLSQHVAGVSLGKLGELQQAVGSWFAETATGVMDKAGVAPETVIAIGSHGQTIRHEPNAESPFSLQLDAPSLIAARTGCPVVADFRNSDIALGGQGAPLVCAFHRDVFAHSEQARFIVNIGGIANITSLPETARRDLDSVTGFDTGPGNALMDAWIGEHFDQPMDADGRWAKSGEVDTALLQQMIADPYFSRAAPKSTGREYFNLDWLYAQIESLETMPRPVDVQATLCELSARTIAQGINEYGEGNEQVLLCGGGSHNRELKRRLAAAVSPRPLASTTDYGVDANWVEAIAFAWLAMRTMHRQSGNVPSVTGARAPAPLGGTYWPPFTE